jgi:hypothetical protein
VKNISTQEQTDTLHVMMAATPLRLPDASSAVDGALAQALDFCAARMGFDGPQAALERMRRGDPVARDYCHYSLAKQVAQALGSLDENTQSVSLYSYDATPEDLSFGDSSPTSLIHLIVRAERQTSALTSLVAALDRALVQEYAALIGPRRLAHLLDVQVITPTQVEQRTGVAALLSSIHSRPIQLWAQ